MIDLLQILCYDIFPLLFFMGAGAVLDAKFKLELATYSKLVIWVVLPSFIFYSMVQYRPSADALRILAAGVLLILGMLLLAFLTAPLLSIGRACRRVFAACAAYSNAGNIGTALIVFIYSHAPYSSGNETPYLVEAQGTMVLLLILMNIAANLFGACQIHGSLPSPAASLRFFLRMPALYAVLAGLLLPLTGISLTHTFIWPVFHHFSSAFIVMVTIIAGIQLHRSRFRRPGAAVLLAAAEKLLAAPALALLIIALFGSFSPIEAQVFLIYAAIPSSFTIILYAGEYENNSNFAAGAVITATALGILTMPLIIYGARLLFPAAAV